MSNDQFPVGSRVHVKSPPHNARNNRGKQYAGQAGTIVWLTKNPRTGMQVNDQQGLAWGFVAFDTGSTEALWHDDLEAIEDALDLGDEAILRMFQIEPHNHECKHCGMRMSDE